MTFNLYQIDAFTDTVFGGNPACVVPLKRWLPDAVLLNIAKENAVAETAFFIIDEHSVKLRWFTSEIEMDLCGHATLATAHCLLSILRYPKNKIIFETLSGHLTVSKQNDLYQMDFPSRTPAPAELPESIKKSLNKQPKEVYKARDYMLVYESQQDIENIVINRSHFDQINLDPGGVIVTAKGDDCDFVSRFFTPQAAILEDPVTGSAHCTLTPFWATQLNKSQLYAKQLSHRIGTLYCEHKKDRVLISGKAKTFAKGTFQLDL